ncbi:syntaxin binding protein 6 (amisyn) [Cricetulus griseus]
MDEGNSILHSAADSVTSAVQKASQALNERGERLGRAEEKTEDMKNSAQQFAETAHKVSQQKAGSPCWVIGGHSAKKLRMLLPPLIFAASMLLVHLYFYFRGRIAFPVLR